MASSTVLSTEDSDAGRPRSAIVAKLLTVEQKLWLADQVNDKKQSAQELATQYCLRAKFIYTLAKRRREGVVIHQHSGRPHGAKNKNPTVKKRLRPVGATVEVMPGMGNIVPCLLPVEEIAIPSTPEPSFKLRRSTRSTVV